MSDYPKIHDSTPLRECKAEMGRWKRSVEVLVSILATRHKESLEILLEVLEEQEPGTFDALMSIAKKDLRRKLR